MTRDPFFSVIIPTFNRAYVLERALKSVLNQSFQDFDLWVVDDGSSDQTSALLKGYAKYIKVLRHENRGVSFSRNRAAGEARGSWLCFLDSDDEWLPEKLEKQFAEIMATDPVAVHGEELWVRHGKRVNPKKKHQKGGGDQFLPSLERCMISPSTIAIRRDIFWQLGGFREDFEVCEDYDLWLKLTSLYEISFIGDPLIIKYGGHRDQLSQKYKAMDWWRLQSLLWIWEHRNLPSKKRAALEEEIRYKTRVLELGYQKHHRQAELVRLKELLHKFVGQLS